MKVLNCLSVVGICSVLLLTGQPAVAKSFPNRMITIVEPFQPGGIADTIYRLFAVKLSTKLGVSVIVINKPGASGIVAMQYVLNAPADGYTLFGIPSSVPVLWAVKKVQPFPLDRFKPVSDLVTQYNSIVASPSLGIKTGQQLIAYLKAHPGTVTFGTTGVGSSVHLFTEELALQIGVPMVPVHYDGQAPIINDLLGGHLDIFIGTFPNFHDPRLPVLAVAAPERVPFAPDIPTFKELGYPNYIEYSFFGLTVPANTPQDRVDVLEKAVMSLRKDSDLTKKLENLSLTPSMNGEASLGNEISNSLQHATAISNKIGLKID
jgi:tripartite-type tricarboxylate transporter receptor subunit TctC